MGKAKILSGGENGLYTIQLDYGDEERDKVVEKLAGRLKELAPQLDEAKAKLDEAKGKENASKDATKDATDEYVAATEVVPVAFEAVTTATNDLPGKADALQRAIGWLKSVAAMEPPASPEQLASAEAAVAAADAAHKSAQGALKTAEAEYAQAQADVKTKMDAQVAAAKKLVEAKKETAPLEIAHELLTDERAQLIKDRSYYAGLQLHETRKAWCADLTEDAKDEVATIEIPGDSNLVLINAGAEDGDTVDGALFAREMQSPEQVFWNAAVLPGWQKWKPTYRRGTITALDIEADTADVALEEETSTGQKLDINQTKTLEAVPVNYMGCNAEAFEVGDACVVRFDGMNWDTPKVMGFVASPKACPGGIGISTDTVTANDTLTDMAIYRPPTGPAQGQWTKRVAKELNGGVAYVAKGGMVLVESGAGLFRGNKRVAGALHGASEAPYIGGGQSFPVSGLFISHGAVQQLKASGDSLLLAGRALRQLGNTSSIMQAATYALPAAPQGERWGMASAAQDGSKFAVCRIKTEEGASDYVTAVAHFAEDTSVEDDADAPEQQGAMLVLESVQETDRQVGRQTPNDPVSAPEWGEFSRTKEGENADTLTEYRETTEFESDSTYRVYIGHSGDVVIDTAKCINDVKISDTHRYLSRVYVSDGGSEADVETIERRAVDWGITRSEEINFFGSHKIQTYLTKVDYKKLDEFLGEGKKWISEWFQGVYPITSTSASVQYTNTITSSISREINEVLLADEQFAVVVAVKIVVEYSSTQSSGVEPVSASGRGTYVDSVMDAAARYGDWNKTPPLTPLPKIKESSVDNIAVSLEVLSGSGSSSVELDSSSLRRDAVKRRMDFTVANMEIPSSGRDYYFENSDGSGYGNGVVKSINLNIDKALHECTGGWVAEKLSDILYAKDPKTGVGFLSFTWDGETKNYVVGSWGVEPSSSRTEVASDAKVSRVVSV